MWPSNVIMLLLAACCNANLVPLAADPLPMSAITLTGEWGHQVERNRDVLMSINLTSWACHFTTTANLTACRAQGTLWHTYLKDAKNASAFTHKLGFLSAGDDVKPPADRAFAACESACISAAACLGFTFQSNNATPATPVKCYLKSAVHFTPQKKQANCLTPGNPAKPACAPLPGEMGLGGYYGHYQGHWLSATSFLINATGNATVKTHADAAIDLLTTVMAAWKATYGYDGYLFPFDPVVWDRLLAGHGARPYYSVPFYTLHKLMAGLLDQYIFAGSAKALTLCTKMASWVHTVVERTITTGGEALWQKVLLTEWGGMNDVLLELYRHTNDKMHYDTARRFNGYVFTARLAIGQDDIADLPFPHANFHLPEIIGNARAYELTGNTTDKAIVETFFDALTANHSYCTGGSNSGECWQQPRDLGNFLSTQTEESCTQYNVLKIARHLFRWHADVKYADFYERAILNGIIGNQRKGKSTCGTPSGCDDKNCDGSCRSPGARGLLGGSGADGNDMTSYIYMLPLGGAVTKPWGKSDYGFPCCWGTLSESFAKLSDSIFFAAPDASAFYVNLYESATADWPARPGITIEQVGHFPVGKPGKPHATSTITIHVADKARGKRATFALRVRVPSWMSGKATVTINGKEVQEGPIVAGSYLTLANPPSGEWHDADTIELSFPMAITAAPLNDKHAWHNATVAFMYGPLVLAGVDITTDIFVPPDGGVAKPSGFIYLNGTSPSGGLQFVAVAKDGSLMRMIPLRDVMGEKYVVYFYTAGTKPPQPGVHYCPHSAPGGVDHDGDHREETHGDEAEEGDDEGEEDERDYHHHHHHDNHHKQHHKIDEGHGRRPTSDVKEWFDLGRRRPPPVDDGHGHGTEEEEAALLAEGNPPAPPTFGSVERRGVTWAVDPAGQMLSLQMPA